MKKLFKEMQFFISIILSMQMRNYFSFSELFSLALFYFFYSLLKQARIRNLIKTKDSNISFLLSQAFFASSQRRVHMVLLLFDKRETHKKINWIELTKLLGRFGSRQNYRSARKWLITKKKPII